MDPISLLLSVCGGGLLLCLTFAYVSSAPRRRASATLAQHFGWKVGPFGAMNGTYRGYEITVEAAPVVAIQVGLRRVPRDGHIMDANLWLVRKGLTLVQSPEVEAGGRDDPQRLEALDTALSGEFEVWGQPAGFAEATLAHQPELGPQLVASACQRVEVNWLFPGVECRTDLHLDDLAPDELRSQLDVAVAVARAVESAVPAHL